MISAERMACERAALKNVRRTSFCTTMNNFKNTFKQALKDRHPQIGLWLGLANPYTTDICAGAGFDWLLIDGEHSPNDINSILAQLQVISGHPTVHAVARVPVGHGHIGVTLIKQYLDIGVQSILVPMVDNAQQARDLVRATRYPPEGIRGMGGARASRWGRIKDYARHANQEICLLVQVETQESLNNIEEIAAVEGVDGVFIGPSDLSASMGYVGQQDHPAVRAAIEGAFSKILKAGKAPGFLTADEKLSKHYLNLGGVFMAVGVEAVMLAQQTQALAERFKTSNP